MTKYRLEITKGEPVRYLSHLDYARTVERAVRRAKLPVAYSEGFNPHMKMAFASALSVGVTSDAEYLDLELATDFAAAALARQLAAQLPAGLTLKRLRVITDKHAALMAVVNLATYRAGVPGGDATAAQAALTRFNAAETARYVRESPKGTREINVKQYLAEPVGAAPVGAGLELSLAIRITPTGSVKPSEVLTVLARDFGLPADPAAVRINRTGLYVASERGRLTPLEV